MNKLVENGLINEIACGENLACILEDSSLFIPIEYKVMQSQTDETFIKCMKLLFNGKIQLYYLTDNHKSLKNILHSLNAESFMIIMGNLFSSVITVKNNGFLSCQNIDVSLEHIFVHPATYKVSLVYLPINKRIYFDTAEFENVFRTSLIDLVQNLPFLHSEKVEKFINNLSDNMLSLENIFSHLSGIAQVKRSNTFSKTSAERDLYNKTAKLVAINAPVSLEIPITKDEFILGRKQDLVDGAITFNKMIGRVHCKFVRQNGRYALIDLKSSNGTYVNNMRLQPEQPFLIHAGDIIRLANSEFKIVME